MVNGFVLAVVLVHTFFIGFIIGKSWPSKQVRKLRDLVRHCWVHDGYDDCGYKQMSGEQKRLYVDIIAEEHE